MISPNPILVEVIRGATVESFHRGAACIADASGRVVAGWGDVEHPICPRSAIKPFQALPLLESGAADAFALSAEEIALACASHGGAPQHVSRVVAWLARIGLSAADLECGAHLPSDATASDALVGGGTPPSPVHNNCSGKHTGFLTLARHLNLATRGYSTPDHPVQRAVLKALAEITDANTDATVRDGCSAPNVFIPLRALATGFARLGDPRGLAPARQKAAARIVEAMKAHPILLSGEGRPCAKLITALSGRAVVKTGAEGVFGACVPEQGLGFAVKIDDGAGRAAVVAITALLDSRGAFRADKRAIVDTLKELPTHAWAGARTGVVRPSARFPKFVNRGD